MSDCGDNKRKVSNSGDCKKKSQIVVKKREKSQIKVIVREKCQTVVRVKETMVIEKMWSTVVVMVQKARNFTREQDFYLTIKLSNKKIMRAQTVFKMSNNKNIIIIIIIRQ